jgi:hypothetical protein
MLQAFRLIPALQVIFRSEIELSTDSFVELNAGQREAYQRKMGTPDEPVYRVVPMEPTVISGQDNERITVELSVVSASERQLLLDAVEFVYRASTAMPEKTPTFEQRLAYLRPKLPPIVIGSDERN